VVALLKKEKVLTVAIAFLNSYKNPIHEQQIGRRVERCGRRIYFSIPSAFFTDKNIAPRRDGKS
jgi:N-methylhydantoinase A/oxoprolinase/acetone carboxylase beta subunit